MKSFKSFISEKREEGAFPISDADKKRLQRMSQPTTSPMSSERLRRGLESATERTKRLKRTVPSSRVISTPEGPIITNIPSGTAKTPEEQIARAERGRTLSTRTQKVADELRGRATTSPEAKKAASRILGGIREPEVRYGGKSAPKGTGQAYRDVRPSETISSGVPSKPKPVKQAEVSKQQAEFRKAFGNPTGIDKEGKATYTPPKTSDLPSSEQDAIKSGTARRAERSSSPRTYASVKAEIEAAKGFGGIKSGGLEMRTPPKPVTDYRQKRASRAGIEDPFSPKSKPFSQTAFEKNLRKTVKKQVVATGARPTPTAPDPFKGAVRIPKVSRPQGAPDRTATKQAVKDLRTSQQNLNIGTGTGGQVSKRSTGSVPVKKNALAIRSGSPMHQGALDAAMGNVSKVKVKTIEPPSKNLAVKGQYRNVNVGTKETIRQTRQPQPYRISNKTQKIIDTVKSTRKPQPYRNTATTRDTFTTPKEPAVTQKTINREVSKAFEKSERKSTSRFTKGAGALAALGAYKEFQYGKEDARASGVTDAKANIAGGLRAAGAFLGATGGALVGRKVGGSLGGAVSGGYGYVKGAQAGSWLAKKVLGK